MIFFIDIGIFFLIALAVGAGIAGTFASWVLDNIIIVLFLLILKSVLLFSGAGLFALKENIKHIVCTVIVLVIDVGRNTLLLYCIVQMLGDILSGGLFNFFLGILGFLIGGPLLLLAGEGPMYFVYDWGISSYDETKFGILLEAVSIIAMLLIVWLGGGF